VRELALTGNNRSNWLAVIGFALIGSGIALMIRNRRALRAKA